MDNIDIIFKKIYIDNKFIEENDEGNIEYKLRIDLKNTISIKKLKTQLTWRAVEGYDLYGTENAFYVIGIYDDGTLGNLTEDDIDTNIHLFRQIITELNFDIIEDCKKIINNSYIYITHIVKSNINKNISEKNVIIIGDPQSGKTTLLSKICYDTDLKQNIFKHSHEKISGITTDIKKEIIGIKNNKLINYTKFDTWDELYKYSDDLINIYDIPVINIKNTISYMMSINIDYCIIISKTKILSRENTLYVDYCKYYNIKYKIFLSADILIYDKDVFTDIFIEIIKNTINETNNEISDNSLFRILESYDIPEKNNIVSGLQTNGTHNIGDKLYIINNTDVSQIIIKSIHIKNLNYKSIKQYESGCVCFDFVSNKKIKVNKNTYITNEINKSYKSVVLHTSLDVVGTFLCRIYNGNNYYSVYCIIDNYNVEFNKNLIFTSNKLIFEINNIFFFNKFNK